MKIKLIWNLIWIVVFVFYVHTAHVGMSCHCYVLPAHLTILRVARLIVALVTLDSEQG